MKFLRGLAAIIAVLALGAAPAVAQFPAPLAPVPPTTGFPPAGSSVVPVTPTPPPVIYAPPAGPAPAMPGQVWDPYHSSVPGAYSTVPMPPAYTAPAIPPPPGIAAPMMTSPPAAPMFPGGMNWGPDPFHNTGISPRVGGGALIGNDVGLTDGYGWIQGMAPLWQKPGQDIWFVDLRGLKYFESGDAYGINAALGYRIFDNAVNRTYGGYGGWDYRNTGLYDFQQISLGLESLGALWDFRGNGYIVISGDDEFVGFSNPVFVDNNLQVTASYVSAMSGFDLEAGRNITPQAENFDLRLFGGMYGFFQSASEDAWGVRARLEGRWWNRVTVNASVQYDQVFDTSFFLSASILLGGSQHADPCVPANVAERLGDPIYKNMHIVLNQRNEQQLLINPADNQPFFFLHVDSNAVAGGDGSFLTPYNTLAGAQGSAELPQTDIVYVHGDSIFTNESFAVNVANQRFLGSSAGVTHTLVAQSFGTVEIPTIGTNAPIIADSTATAVTINAANVEVSGFDIIDPITHGIFVNNFGGFDINRNQVTGADANNGGVGEGIFVNFTGTPNGTGDITQNIVSGGNRNGIRIETGGGGSFAGTVSQNESTANAFDGFLIGSINGGSVTDNQASGNGGDGFDISVFNSGQIRDNLASGNTLNGMLITSVAGGFVSDNLSIGNTLSGFVFTTVSGTANISDNRATANNLDGFFFNSITGGLVDGNMATSNQDDGFDINAFTGGQFNNQVSNNNNSDGYEVTGAVAPASAVNNTGAGNAANNTFTFP